MDWQLVAVVPIVALAGGYLLRRTWRAWGGRKAGCGGGCGCKAPAADRAVTFIPAESVALRPRDER
jgi:hypothetical protein